MKILVILIILTLFVPIRVSLYAKSSLTFGGVLKSPYINDPKSNTPGFMVEILRRVFEKEKIEVKIDILPMSRAIHYTNIQKLDGVIGVSRKNAPTLIFPEEEIGVSQLRFYVSENSQWTYSGLNSLKDATLGIVRGFSYGEMDSYFRVYEKNKNRVQAVNLLELNIRKLKFGRITAILEDYMPINYYQTKYENIYLKEAGRLTKNNLYVAFSKNNESERYSHMFSNTIRNLRNSGELDKILAKYGLSDWKKETFIMKPLTNTGVKSIKKSSNIFSYNEYDVIEVNYVTANTEDSIHGVFAKKFKELIEKKTEGKIKINIDFISVFGSEQDNIIETSAGNIQMSTAAVNNISIFAPVLHFMNLPYIFPTSESVDKLLNSILMENINREMVNTANFRALAWNKMGYRSIANSKRSIKNLNDLKGIKVRVPENPIMIETWRAWGVEPIPIAWIDSFEAIGNGIVDGIWVSPSFIKSNNYHKVTSYLTKLHDNLLLAPLIINEDFYQALSKELQLQIKASAKEAAEFTNKWAKKDNIEAIEWFIENGMTYSELENEQDWIEKSKSVWPIFYDKVGGKEFLDSVIEIIEN